MSHSPPSGPQGGANPAERARGGAGRGRAVAGPRLVRALFARDLSGNLAPLLRGVLPRRLRCIQQRLLAPRVTRRPSPPLPVLTGQVSSLPSY